MSSAPATSTVYVKVPVSAKESGVATDPTSGTVTMMFTAVGAASPAAGDAGWLTASWETDSSGATPRYLARCLTGPSPGLIEFTPGTANLPWVKITGITPEAPIIKAAATHSAT